MMLKYKKESPPKRNSANYGHKGKNEEYSNSPSGLSNFSNLSINPHRGNNKRRSQNNGPNNLLYSNNNSYSSSPLDINSSPTTETIFGFSPAGNTPTTNTYNTPTTNTYNTPPTKQTYNSPAAAIPTISFTPKSTFSKAIETLKEESQQFPKPITHPSSNNNKFISTHRSHRDTS